MQILKDNPVKTQIKVYLLTFPDGKQMIYTGRYSPGYSRNRPEEYRGLPYGMFEYLDRGVQQRLIKLPVIEMKFKINKVLHGNQQKFHYTMGDSETGFIYEVSLDGLMGIIDAIQAGELKVVDGAVHGLFTFTKAGSEVRMVPYTAESIKLDNSADEYISFEDEDILEIENATAKF